MPDINHRVPFLDGHGGFIVMTEKEDGGFTDNYGACWSPPITKVGKRLEKLSTFKVFGQAIETTSARLDWRTLSRNNKVELVVGFYPGFTPLDRLALRDLRLYIEVAGGLLGPTVTWFDDNGRYTFTAHRQEPEAALHMLDHAIDHVTDAGDRMDQVMSWIA